MGSALIIGIIGEYDKSYLMLSRNQVMTLDKTVMASFLP